MFRHWRNFSDESRRLARILASLDRTTPVLDVGCGYGRNLDLLRALGFRNIEGVEKNPDLVNAARARGHVCHLPEELEARGPQYQLLVMSHIVEHFDYASLQGFIESYLARLAAGGRLLIVTPLLHGAFYNDFDHVKPYYPMGFRMVFGNDLSQVQFQSEQVLELEDLAFFKDQWRLQYFRGLYLPGANRLPIHANRLLKLVFIASCGLIGKKIGWMGLYRYRGHRTAGAG